MNVLITPRLFSGLETSALPGLVQASSVPVKSTIFGVRIYIRFRWTCPFWFPSGFPFGGLLLVTGFDDLWRCKISSISSESTCTTIYSQERLRERFWEGDISHSCQELNMGKIFVYTKIPTRYSRFRTFRSISTRNYTSQSVKRT